MTKFEKLIKEKIRILKSNPEMLSDGAKRAENAAWDKIFEKLSGLDVKDGNILQTSKNIRIIEEISSIIKGALSSIEYGKAMVEFIKSMDKSVQITNELAQIIKKNFQPNQVQKELYEVAKKNAVETLFGETITGAATSEVRDILTASVAGGNNFYQTVKSLRNIVKGEGEGDGKILGRIRTYAGTTQSVVDRSYTKLVSDSIDAEWFLYQGSEIETTRKFCADRHDQYFHKKEIESWGNGDDPTNIGGIKKNGTWDGEIEGTNSYSIFSLAGGWNCRHSIIPVSEFMVPDTVIARNAAVGFVKN